MKSYYELGLDEFGGECTRKELSCSCFMASKLYSFWWYVVPPFDNEKIYMDTINGAVELAPTWKSSCDRYWRRYK